MVSKFARVSEALGTTFVFTSIRASVVRRVSTVVSSAASVLAAICLKDAVIQVVSTTTIRRINSVQSSMYL
jgi:hypothetical protein